MGIDPAQWYENANGQYATGFGDGGSAELDDYSRALHNPELATTSNYDSASVSHTNRVIQYFQDLIGRMKTPHNPYHKMSEYQQYVERTQGGSSHLAVTDANRR